MSRTNSSHCGTLLTVLWSYIIQFTLIGTILSNASWDNKWDFAINYWKLWKWY
jgi:hypothetical protein